MHRRRRGFGLVAVVVPALLFPIAAGLSAAGSAVASGAKPLPVTKAPFTRVEYLAPNPLGRSRVVTLDAEGRLVVRDTIRTSAGSREQRWSMRAPAATVSAVAGLLAGLREVPEVLHRTGVPGESIVVLRVTPRGDDPDATWHRSKWLGDRQPGFDEAEMLLTELARRAVASGLPAAD
ncbi:MAG: hypothetical protein Q8M17_13165 [Actinomycetota bacterium]|jgi:hypothetical protein|nr:hypothetical protein [Actinomycetota bacterium]